MTPDIVTDALTMAWFRKRPAPGLLHPSDRGSQYAPRLPGQAPGIWHDLLDEPEGQLLGQRPDGKRVQPLQERAGAGRPVRHPADMKAASFEYIEVFYNRKRQHSTLGYLSPIQFLEHWVRHQHQEKPREPQGFLQGGGTVTGFNLDAPGCLGLAISLKRRLCASAANLESEQF
jgi:putative transposase